jgi:hypothetical protein
MAGGCVAGKEVSQRRLRLWSQGGVNRNFMDAKPFSSFFASQVA